MFRVALGRSAVAAFAAPARSTLISLSVKPLSLSLSSPRHWSSSPASFKSSPGRRLAKEWAVSEPVTYEELKPLTESPNDSILLIDVREPDEVALGNIPSSVNLPLSTFEKSLSLDEGDFTKINGFHKPTKDQQIIFYCRSGVRSTTATELARRAGYKAVRNYQGSWLDWQAKNAKSDD